MTSEVFIRKLSYPKPHLELKAELSLIVGFGFVKVSFLTKSRAVKETQRSFRNELMFLSFPAYCKEPASPQNGARHGNEFEHNKRISFTCLPGFQLTGSANAVCINGKWSHPVPRCKGMVLKCVI